MEKTKKNVTATQNLAKPSAVTPQRPNGPMNFKDYEEDIIAKAKSAHIPGMPGEDIAQEFRIAIWLAQRKFNPELASARTFAVRIMDNKLIDLYRKSRHYRGRC